MQQYDHKLQLIWDIDRFRCHIHEVEIAMASLQFPPFSVNAVVEEQDTSLVLGESNEISDPGDKPVWYFTNKLQSLTALTPGEVIVRKSRPMRMQAIVHDLDREPTCNEFWVQQALEKIVDATNTHHVHALQMPLLGTRYSDMTTAQFLQLLLESITQQEPAYLRRLWLVTPEQQCEAIFQELDSLLAYYA